MNNRDKIITYKKKYKKSFCHYLSLMLMADVFDLPEDKRQVLFDVLDEQPCEEWEWNRARNKSRRIINLFSRHRPEYSFYKEYTLAVEMAEVRIRVMSN